MELLFLGQGRLYEALGIRRGVTALVGGGGKTSAMLRLGKELAALGKVVIATTTHIFPPQGMPVLLEPNAQALASALERFPLACAGSPRAGGKLGPCGLAAEALMAMADYVLLEADGAKGKPLKAPAPHEPVIPPCTGAVVAVAGLDGLGSPIGEAAFRPELYAGLLGVEQSHIVAPADAAKVLCSREGQYKGVGPGMDFFVLLNKADDETRRALGERTAAALDAARVKGVVIARLGRRPQERTGL